MAFRSFVNGGLPLKQIIAIILFLAASSADAEELGMEQKVKQAYELYHINKLSSLHEGSWSFGSTFSYSTNHEQALGVSSSTQGISVQSFLNYGFGNGYEANISFPYSLRNEQVSVLDDEVSDVTSSNLGLPAFRLTKTIPVEDFAYSVSGSFTPTLNDDSFHAQYGVSLGVNARMRPAFVSGNLGLNYDSETDVPSITYHVGTGLSVNSDLVLGADISGEVFAESNNGVLDNVSLDLKAAYQATPNLGITVGSSVGVSGDVPDHALSFGFVRRF